MEAVKVLFVCLGNICRSPMAEGLFLDLIEKENISDKFEVDSAGTSGHHVGERADRRMRMTAESHGVELPSRSRQIKPNDLYTYDYILAMDRSNLRNIEALQHAGKPATAKILLMRKFDHEANGLDVPDPYYGGQDGFEDVYQMLQRSNIEFLEHVKTEQSI